MSEGTSTPETRSTAIRMPHQTVGAPDEESPQLMITTSDLGTILFPEHCPDWCDRAAHIEYAHDEQMPAHLATAHLVSGGEATLHELRNPTSTRIERDGGGEWWLDCRQELADPGKPLSGYTSPPLIRLMVRDRGLGEHFQAQISLTSGEARVLLHKLQKLVDHVDGGVLS